MEKSYNNKIHLVVKKDKYNNWYKFEKRNIRVQLAGDSRKGGFWLEQYADKVLGDRKKFMSDFTNILKEMEKDNKEIFSMYILPEVLNFITEENNGN